MSDVEAMVAWLRSVHEADEQAARDASGTWWHVGQDRSLDVGQFGLRSPDDERGVAVRRTYVHGSDGIVALLRDWYRVDPGLMPSSGPRERWLGRGEENSAGNGEHIARHDPDDVLARIEGERRILTEYERSVDLYESDREAPDGVAALEIAVRALAFGYRHRDGWQQGWAP